MGIAADSPASDQLEVVLLGPGYGECCVVHIGDHLAVVVLIQVGDTAMLFGSDLEETADQNTGWSVIVNSVLRPQIRATIFKVPHHGSENADNGDVWASMLVDRPIAILTPHHRGRTRLPTQTDVVRITSRTESAWSSSRGIPQVQRRRPEVAKEINIRTKRFVRTDAATGAIRLRNGGARTPATWCVELSNGACHLTEM